MQPDETIVLKRYPFLGQGELENSSADRPRLDGSVQPVIGVLTVAIEVECPWARADFRRRPEGRPSVNRTDPVPT